MPLVVVDGQVLYRRPKKDELPVIGRMYFNNQIHISKQRDQECRNLSKSMSLLQKALLKGKKNVVV
jgi:hypothetical protein